MESQQHFSGCRRISRGEKDTADFTKHAAATTYGRLVGSWSRCPSLLLCARWPPAVSIWKRQCGLHCSITLSRTSFQP